MTNFPINKRQLSELSIVHTTAGFIVVLKVKALSTATMEAKCEGNM